MMTGMARAARVGVQTSRLGASAILTGVAIWVLTNILIKLSSQPVLSFAVCRIAALPEEVLEKHSAQLREPVRRRSGGQGMRTGISA
jgi:hypothetical protein